MSEVLQVPYREVDANVLGRCPAAVDMTNGVISINKSVWDDYDKFEQNFILMHEIGHYELDTDSEFEADEYALRNVYRTAPCSLKRALKTLCKIRVIDPRRLENLYKVALTLDAADGNALAGIELQRLNYFNQSINHTKKSETMTKKQGKVTYPTQRKSDMPTIRVIRRADGGKSHGMNGLLIGNIYFSFTNLLLAAILIAMLAKN